MLTAFSSQASSPPPPLVDGDKCIRRTARWSGVQPSQSVPLTSDPAARRYASRSPLPLNAAACSANLNSDSLDPGDDSSAENDVRRDSCRGRCWLLVTCSHPDAWSSPSLSVEDSRRHLRVQHSAAVWFKPSGASGAGEWLLLIWAPGTFWSGKSKAMSSFSRSQQFILTAAVQDSPTSSPHIQGCSISSYGRYEPPMRQNWELATEYQAIY